MTTTLKLSTGQYSAKGRKDINQDFHGIFIPNEPHLSTKGAAIAIADGISSSDVSHVASQAAVIGFLDDYFCTPDTWSVKKSAQRVLMATNSWLHAQTRRGHFYYDKDRGYVCTLSAMVIKSTSAHIFHIGDTRIYRLRGDALEQLTNDHRTWVSREMSYLSRAMGVDSHVEIDYRTLPVDLGDCFVFSSDGVYDHIDDDFIIKAIHGCDGDLGSAAKSIVDHAFAQGSTDNLTVQITRIDELPCPASNEIYLRVNELPIPPVLEARAVLDCYTIIREIHASSRSHVYLAKDDVTNTTVVIKTPSIDRQNDLYYLERFLMEEWIARRISSAHVLKPYASDRPRTCLYIVMEFIEGQTLTQWMANNPMPDLDTAVKIVEQIAKGLQAFHRLEMLHQDLRPDNIMIDATGILKIIDFGSTNVAGIMEIERSVEHPLLLGTAQFTAPEYFIGEGRSPQSDIFSLGVIAYQMLTGNLPYGTAVAKTKTRSEQKRLQYDPITRIHRHIPLWIDEAIRKSVHPDPYKRYPALSEFIFDLRQPNKAFINSKRPPLLERNPVAFWQMISLILALVVITLLSTQGTVW